MALYSSLEESKEGPKWKKGEDIFFCKEKLVKEFNQRWRKKCRGHKPWPALEGGHSKQRHHALQDVVKVEFTVVPLSLGSFRFPDVAVLVHNVKSPANRTHCFILLG